MTDNIQKHLHLTDGWVTLGLVTPAILERLAAEYMTGDDPHPEHYRWRLFTSFLHTHTPLQPAILHALYDLGHQDADDELGTSIMMRLIELPECPRDLLESASTSDHPALKKKAYQRLLQAEADN